MSSNGNITSRSWSKNYTTTILNAFLVFDFSVLLRSVNSHNTIYNTFKFNELDIPFELGRAIRTKEISQAEYETKYKKHLQTLKLGLEIDKTDRVAVSVEDTSGYYEYKEKCYTVILPEFIKKSLGLKKIINM